MNAWYSIDGQPNVSIPLNFQGYILGKQLSEHNFIPNYYQYQGVTNMPSLSVGAHTVKVSAEFHVGKDESASSARMAFSVANSAPSLSEPPSPEPSLTPTQQPTLSPSPTPSQSPTQPSPSPKEPTPTTTPSSTPTPSPSPSPTPTLQPTVQPTQTLIFTTTPNPMPYNVDLYFLVGAAALVAIIVGSLAIYFKKYRKNKVT
jgi:hypothetical protein